MLTVERYALSQVAAQTIDLPTNWQPLCVLVIANTPTLWVYGDDELPLTPVEVLCYKDGEKMAKGPLKYLGSSSQYAGAMIQHFFARGFH